MSDFDVQKVMRKLRWPLLFGVSLALPALADTYYIDNPSLICKAHFKTSFNEFVTQDGDNFVLEFDEKQYQSKAGLFSKFKLGFKYNGLIEGKHAAMLLNWPDNSEKGILTILASDYPCRASYFKEQPIQMANSDETAGLNAEKKPTVQETDVTSSGNIALRGEIVSLIDTDKNSSSINDVQPVQSQKPFDAGSQSDPEKGPPVDTQSPSNQSSDVSQTTAPSISIAGISVNGPQGVVEGYVSDEVGIAELQINGRTVVVNSDGRFSAKTFVPIGGAVATITAFNAAGMSSSMAVMLERADETQTAFSFEELNPLKREVVPNEAAVAIIVGVGTYANTDADAIYADTDAQVFQDYAVEKLGVPANRIKTLVNDAADERGVLLAVIRWLTRAVEQGQSDVYVFFAGHGLASDDGEKMYLLPYDGAPELLDRTAILRDELFMDIAAANPRSVTVFLDTCYSGTTRGPEMLVASRPIAIRAKESAIPEGFTVMTAAAGDQTAKPLEEAKHGMFSYFLMKGMEGDADANQDNQITAGELHAFVKQNVEQQSSGSQTPELQGDADRVLVRFQ
ncbi:MAG: hypothetical protein CMQ16_00030 [Gammaproteobacteria bacterium]|nr:hypothetical protein [Gammaproteobacteria bacterium]